MKRTINMNGEDIRVAAGEPNAMAGSSDHWGQFIGQQGRYWWWVDIDPRTGVAYGYFAGEGLAWPLIREMPRKP